MYTESIPNTTRYEVLSALESLSEQHITLHVTGLVKYYTKSIIVSSVKHVRTTEVEEDATSLNIDKLVEDDNTCDVSALHCC